MKDKKNYLNSSLFVPCHRMKRESFHSITSSRYLSPSLAKFTLKETLLMRTEIGISLTLATLKENFFTTLTKGSLQSLLRKEILEKHPRDLNTNKQTSTLLQHYFIKQKVRLLNIFSIRFAVSNA